MNDVSPTPTRCATPSMCAMASPRSSMTLSSQLWKCSAIAAPGPNLVMPLRKSFDPTRCDTSGIVLAPPPRSRAGISAGRRITPTRCAIKPGLR
jgi:hypothetical protein